MKLGVMQPYFFPYIGYWQLMNTVDTYIIYDDVNFIKGGWINRNRILDGTGGTRYINVFLRGASPYKLIREIQVDPDIKHKNSFLSIIRQIYSGAPNYNTVIPLLEDIIMNTASNIADFNVYLIKRVCDYIGITTNIILSSDIEKDNTKKGQDKILDICRIMGASEYYNAIGGKNLYDKEAFANRSIKLGFLQTKEIKYKQFENDVFYGNLSIIDVLMFNDKNTIGHQLREYEII